MKPNGICYLQFPHGQSIFDLFNDFNYTRYPSSRIENYLLKNGFIIIKSSPLNADKECELGYRVLAKKMG